MRRERRPEVNSAIALATCCIARKMSTDLTSRVATTKQIRKPTSSGMPTAVIASRTPSSSGDGSLGSVSVATMSSGTSVTKPSPSTTLASTRQVSTVQGLMPSVLRNRLRMLRTEPTVSRGVGHLRLARAKRRTNVPACMTPRRRYSSRRRCPSALARRRYYGKSTLSAHHAAAPTFTACSPLIQVSCQAWKVRRLQTRKVCGRRPDR
jgi:hypothetical protein